MLLSTEGKEKEGVLTYFRDLKPLAAAPMVRSKRAMQQCHYCPSGSTLASQYTFYNDNFPLDSSDLLRSRALGIGLLCLY